MKKNRIFSQQTNFLIEYLFKKRMNVGDKILTIPWEHTSNESETTYS